MEAVTVRALVLELARRSVPCRVGGVFQSTARDVVLSLAGKGAGHLVVSAHPSAPGIHLTLKKPRALPSPGPFGLAARRRLSGLLLTGVESRGLEKIVRLLFAPSAAQSPTCILVAELTGQKGNVILLDGEGNVVDSLRTFREGGRVVAPDEVYAPPPAEGREDVSTLDAEGFAAILRRSETEGVPLHRLVLGMGPGLRALAEGRRRGGEGSLFQPLREVLDAVEDGSVEPVFYPGRALVLPLPAPQWEGEERLLFESMSAAADGAWRGAVESGERERVASPVRRMLARRRKKLSRKIEALKGEGKKGGDETFLQAAGRALLASLDQVPRGAASFSFADPASPGDGEATVELDPALGPRKNAEALFRKARKAKRRAADLARRIPAVEREAAAVEETIASLDSLPLEELQSLAAPRGKGGKGKGPAARQAAGLPQIREYRSDSWRILVGKSSRGNDYLTSRVALPDDYWFHVRDYAGAHVVLKPLGASAEPSQEEIQAAGEAAAWHSAARSETLVDVAYARRKHVRKVRGQAPGKVLVPRSETVRVRPRVPEGYREVSDRR